MRGSNKYKLYNTALRIVITIVSISFLIYQLFIKQSFNEMLSDMGIILYGSSAYFYILISAFLMPLNWSLEAVKWKYLLKEKEKISFGTSLKAVLSGATISAVSPNRTGDYFARVFVLRQTSFWDGVFITLIGSFAQTITTLIFGGIALFSIFVPLMVQYDYLSETYLPIFPYLFFGLLCLVVFFYFNMGLMAKWIPQHWTKIQKLFRIFTKFSVHQLSINLLLSIFRYCIFSFQYFLIFKAVGFTDLSIFMGLGIISTIFLINSIRPSIALLEIGIRGSIALFVFGLVYGFNNSMDNQVFTASTLIWLINIILPAIIGLFFIKSLRFFKNKK